MSTFGVAVTALLLTGAGLCVYWATQPREPVYTASPVQNEHPEDMDWETFKSSFGKNYRDEEVAARKSAFEENRAFIARHNAEADEGKHTWRCGVNEFSDLTQVHYRQQLLGYVPSKHTSASAVQFAMGAAPPASVDWRTSGAVTPVKNQGTCGSCWSFSATGSLEGHYQIATGALRTLSEEQLMDCSTLQGNKGCGGGAMTQAFDYIVTNKGIDGETDYPYDGQDSAPCWPAAAKRVMATMQKYTSITAGDEAALVAAVALGPVSVAIEADQPGFQNYKSGVFAGPCGTKLDHGVLVVGYTADTLIVKNSWGPTWGDKGYITFKRGTNLCGVANDASFPNVAKASPVPVPPPTPGHKPGLPCNCSSSCAALCAQVGMWCCGGGVSGKDCDCSSPSSCPQCNPHPPPGPPTGPYDRCSSNDYCETGGLCQSINGMTGMICMPKCAGYTSKCPDPSAKEGTTARPYCDVCGTTAGKESPDGCILVCNATASANGYSQAECGKGATCKPLTQDKDTCDSGASWPAGAHPCQETKTCGMCSFP